MRKHVKVLGAMAAALLLVGALAAAAHAQNARLRPQGRRQAIQNAQIRPGPMLRGLNLTPEQKDQVKTILANHKPEIKEVVKENVQARKELRAALVNGSDQGALKAAYDNVAQAGWKGILLRSTIVAEVKPILTPDQLQRLQKRSQIREALAQRLMKRLGQ
jgi:Spy/CpxP family protein refolding chaperone